MDHPVDSNVSVVTPLQNINLFFLNKGPYKKRSCYFCDNVVFVMKHRVARVAIAEFQRLVFCQIAMNDCHLC